MKAADLKNLKPPFEKGEKMFVVYKSAPFSTMIDPGTRLPVPALNKLGFVWEEWNGSLMVGREVTQDNKLLRHVIDPEDVLFIGRVGDVTIHHGRLS